MRERRTKKKTKDDSAAGKEKSWMGEVAAGVETAGNGLEGCQGVAWVVILCLSLLVELI